VSPQRTGRSVAPNAERHFEYDGLVLRLVCDEPADLEWVEEFLTPQFGIGDGGDEDTSARLSRDGERFRELLAGRDGSAVRERECFVLDQRVIRLPTWERGETLVILEEDRKVAYLVHAASNHTEVVAPHGARARVPIMRLIREFAMNHGLAAGKLFVHASSVVHRGAGLVIAGPSGSGKTSLLIHLLGLDGTDYLSNDRVLVTQQDTETRLRGMPTITTLRTTTLDLFPQLSEDLRGCTFRHRLTLRESEGQTGPPRPWSDGRIGLSPTQFCTLLGARSVAGAPATAFLFPRRTGRSGGMRLTRIPPEEARSLLEQAIFGIGCWSHRARIFALEKDRAVPTAPELIERCTRLTRQVPCFNCDVGPDAYERPEATRAALERLLDEVR
jgi:energy-coupling factor transporter ATP-binding protein EcfA2